MRNQKGLSPLYSTLLVFGLLSLILSIWTLDGIPLLSVRSRAHGKSFSNSAASCRGGGGVMRELVHVR